VAYDSERFESVRVFHLGIVKETEKAKLFKLGEGDDDTKVWVPISQISEEEGDSDGGAFWIPKWLAEEKELDYE